MLAYVFTCTRLVIMHVLTTFQTFFCSVFSHINLNLLFELWVRIYDSNGAPQTTQPQPPQTSSSPSPPDGNFPTRVSATPECLRCLERWSGKCKTEMEVKPGFFYNAEGSIFIATGRAKISQAISKLSTEMQERIT